jgi:hypothetical protein
LFFAQALRGGGVPPDATPYFLSAAKPLISQLLEKWEIRNLRRFLPLINDSTLSHGEAGTTEELKLWELPNDVDPLGVIVSRDEVETLDTGPSLSILRQLTALPATTRRFFERVDIAFHGYPPQNCFLAFRFSVIGAPSGMRFCRN